MEYGYHLVVDALTNMPNVLGNGQHIDQILKTVIRKIGMKLIDGPFITHYEAHDDQESGITAVAILAESHIAIHTWPNKNYLAVDIFSCRPFDIEQTIGFLRQELNMVTVARQFISRGIQVIMHQQSLYHHEFGT
jgi:S-adenosylmethionine decarboxylase